MHKVKTNQWTKLEIICISKFELVLPPMKSGVKLLKILSISFGVISSWFRLRMGAKINERIKANITYSINKVYFDRLNRC
ncbi:hypothetical protein NARC_90069 [Candidatus Nitrosocosmicus arcticus]|uniref:Uncharacterized protein n=1 Tax=Candidatus Nitrosocosmicus arcticus TaxID=2035267 RepID=A0A557SU89_9ARCH|nr:hypothetical protein NARC_90069 [Candidatus Nitrosocosmicus arcticus]